MVLLSFIAAKHTIATPFSGVGACETSYAGADGQGRAFDVLHVGKRRAQDIGKFAPAGSRTRVTSMGGLV